MNKILKSFLIIGLGLDWVYSPHVMMIATPTQR